MLKNTYFKSIKIDCANPLPNFTLNCPFFVKKLKCNVVFYHDGAQANPFYLNIPGLFDIWLLENKFYPCSVKLDINKKIDNTFIPTLQQNDLTPMANGHLILNFCLSG